MNPSKIAGAIHTQYRFPVAPGVEVHPGRFYGFNASGQLVKPQDATAGRKIVYAQERTTGNTVATTKALCAVVVVVIIDKDTLTGDDIGKRVYANTETAVTVTDNSKPCGWLLEVDGQTAAIQLG